MTVIDEIFEEYEFCETRIISSLYKSGEREDMSNWRVIPSEH